MSLTEACAWTLLRSVIVALASIPVCRLLASQLNASPAWERKLAWAALLVPFFSPELIVGYAYRNYSLSLVHYPVWNEILYMLLITLRFIPIGTVVIYFSPPPPISAEGLHCRRLAFRSPFLNRASFWIRGPDRSVLPAGAVMFLLSFQDFELVSLLGTTSWTVWLFEMQVGGVPLSETLIAALLPIACQGVVLGPLLLMLLTSNHLPVGPTRQCQRPLRAWQRIVGWLYLAVALTLLCLVPFSIVFRGTIEGFAVLSQNLSLGRNILNSGILAVAAGASSYVIARSLLSELSSRRSNGVRILFAVICCVPGLLGSLILALCLIHLFQTDVLSGLYDSALPLFLGFVGYLLPRAFLLLLLIQGMRACESLHLSSTLAKSPVVAQQVHGRELIWRQKIVGHFWVEING